MDTQLARSNEYTSTPVLVVGAGPVGCVLALELARHQVPCVLIERSTTPSPHPKMDYVNGRTMELFRRLGLAAEIRSRGVPPQHPSNFVWLRGLSRPPVSVWRYPSPRDLEERIAAAPDGSQPGEAYQRLTGALLEEIVRDRARGNELIDLREGCALTGLRQDPDGVTAEIRDLATGVTSALRARWLVACDGAGSTVRGIIDIPLDLAAPPTSHCDVYFRSSDPALRRHGRAFLTVFASGLTLVSRDEDTTWTGTFPIPPGEPPPGDAISVLLDKFGTSFAIDEVINVAYWQGALAVADRYRQGSVFLAGDSAHHFYPTGGHGANTGVADAVDLGWKLAASVNGWAGPALLDSYEAERRPVALFNREMCANLLEVWRRFSTLAAAGAPDSHIAGFLEQETYQIDNVGIHFGYRYDGSPVICAEDGDPPQWKWREIVPGTWPGGRPPSVRLSDGNVIFDHFGEGFTLVDFTVTGEGEPVVKEAAGRGIPMKHLRIADEAAHAVWESSLVLVRPDQHVAWRGETAPARIGPVLDRVRGELGRD